MCTRFHWISLLYIGFDLFVTTGTFKSTKNTPKMKIIEHRPNAELLPFTDKRTSQFNLSHIISKIKHKITVFLNLTILRYPIAIIKSKLILKQSLKININLSKCL
uniref:(northern house mosquito) hypothetical protein n=1 Tax=Culex pipiens TaxID=7175 RepID=A0A8D8I5W5_CULPI